MVVEFRKRAIVDTVSGTTMQQEDPVNEPVLVLNANYEPLHVCTTKRAVGLMMTGKAELLLDGRGIIRTASSSYPRPSIVRLSYMVHRPYPRVKLSKREIFRRDKFVCQYCGERSPVLTIDHVLPRHRGGRHTWENLVAACPTCNRRKGGRTPQEAAMHLRTQPSEPKASAEYLFGRLLENHDEWTAYLRGW